jgi:forkhead box protein J2/3
LPASSAPFALLVTFREKDMSQQPPPTVMPQNMLPPGEAELAQANSYYPQEPADLTGGLPINLDSLRDGPPGSKPFYPYSTLIR